MILFRLIAYCMTALFTLVLIWALGWMWFAASVVSMNPQSPDTKTDAIIVLTGGDKRINEGFDLLAADKAKLLFISGVNEQVKTEELLQLWKGDQKKVLCCTTLGYSADTTAGNATESEAWIKKNKVASVRLVTANYHMARSSMMFHRSMPDIVIYKHPVVPADFEPWTKKFWILTFQEYNKVLATWLRFDLQDKNPALNG